MSYTESIYIRFGLLIKSAAAEIECMRHSPSPYNTGLILNKLRTWNNRLPGHLHDNDGYASSTPVINCSQCRYWVMMHRETTDESTTMKREVTMTAPPTTDYICTGRYRKQVTTPIKE